MNTHIHVHWLVHPDSKKVKSIQLYWDQTYIKIHLMYSTTIKTSHNKKGKNSVGHVIYGIADYKTSNLSKA